MRIGRIDHRLGLALAFLALVGSMSCAPLTHNAIGQGALVFYQRLSTYTINGFPYQPSGIVAPRGPRGPYAGFVEFDDQGYFVDPKQPRAVLEGVTQACQKSPVTLLVYVHGWRHNSQEGDDDLDQFLRTLDELDYSINSSITTGDVPARAVVGVYIGWRGKAAWELPDCLGPLKTLLSWNVYSTFWHRKATADLVGHGDAQRFLVALGKLRRLPDGYHDCSVTIVGHSFGGHLVLSALRGQLEEALLAREFKDGLDSRSGPVPALGLLPDDSADSLRISDVIQSDIGNVVLINPAVQAGELRYVFGLDRIGRFPSTQTPILSVFSAENDNARRVAFPIGRAISTLGVKMRSKQHRRLERAALGSYPAMITHEMRLPPGEKAADTASFVRPEGEDAARRAAARLCGLSRLVPHIEQVPSDGSRIEVRPVDARPRPHVAVVVKVDKRILNGHSKIFSRVFREWLVDYLTMIDIAGLPPAHQQRLCGDAPKTGDITKEDVPVRIRGKS